MIRMVIGQLIVLSMAFGFIAIAHSIEERNLATLNDGGTP